MPNREIVPDQKRKPFMNLQKVPQAVGQTKSESLFEDFLTDHNIAFERINEAASPRPDYLVTASDLKLIFEIKELSPDQDFGRAGIVYSRTVGSHVRERINASRKQIQYGASQGIPSILLIYNRLDPVFQMWGTEDLDFTTATYGELTILLDKRTRQVSEPFNGRNQSVQEGKNASFSAVGRLTDRGGHTNIALFENLFAKVQVPWEQLPGCFEVQRVQVSRDPLRFV